MAIQFLLVTFPEQRNVLADGVAVGVTNHVLMLPADEYRISLDGDATVPASQNIALDGSSIVQPLVISFAVAAVEAVTRGARAPVAAIAPVEARRSRAKRPAKKTTARKAARSKAPAKKAAAHKTSDPATRSAGKGKPHA